MSDANSTESTFVDIEQQLNSENAVQPSLYHCNERFNRVIVAVVIEWR